MEAEGWLLCSQQPSTGPYSKPDQSSLYHLILSKIHFNIIVPVMPHDPYNYIWQKIQVKKLLIMQFSPPS
jgi:hypothetical protein